jgi:hypothetical protein
VVSLKILKYGGMGSSARLDRTRARSTRQPREDISSPQTVAPLKGYVIFWFRTMCLLIIMCCTIIIMCLSVEYSQILTKFMFEF